MGDVAGYNATVAISTNGSSYTAIGGVKDASLAKGHSPFDVTDFDSGAWEEAIAGRGAWTFDFTMNYDEADTGWELLVAQHLLNTKLYFRYRPRGDTTGYKEYIFQGFVTALDDSSPNDGAAETSCSVQMSGTPTRQNQP